MRIACFDNGGGPQLGIVADGRLAPLIGSDLAMYDARDVFARWGTDFVAASRHIEPALRSSGWLSIDDVRLLPPVLRPGKIIGIGRNYGAHGAEGGLEPQQKPRIFLKTANAIAGPGQAVQRPAGITKLDYEAELVVVVARTLRHASEEQAAAAIGGYTVGNDLSARELQFDVSPPQTSLAKSMDGFAPTGPWVTTADELGSAPDLDIRCWVNGDLRQAGRTGDFIFSIAMCLSYLSRFMTLEAGDLLFTGTPAGVGVFRDPPVFLAPGDRVRIEIERVGVLETEIV